MVFRHYSVNPFFFPFGLVDHDMDALFSESDRVACKSKKAPTTVQPNYVSRANESGTHLDIEMPGVSPENAEVEVREGVLTVTGKRFDRRDVDMERKEGVDPEHKESVETMDAPEAEKETVANKGADEPSTSIIYVLKARLGRDADANGIEARNAGNGMLYVTIPTKKQEVRRIEIM